MSIRAMSRVWAASRQKGSALLLLLAIADFADDDGGNAFPSIATLAQKTRMSRRSVQLLVRKLAATGELHVRSAAGRKGVNVYEIRGPWGANFAPPGVEETAAGGAQDVPSAGAQSLRPLNGRPAQSVARGGATGCAGGAQPVAPEPSLNRQRTSPPNPPKGGAVSRCSGRTSRRPARDLVQALWLSVADVRKRLCVHDAGGWRRLIAGLPAAAAEAGRQVGWPAIVHGERGGRPIDVEREFKAALRRVLPCGAALPEQED